MPALLGGLLCVPPRRGTQDTMQLGACTDRERVSTWVHILGGVGLRIARARAAGHIINLVLRSLPCITHVWSLGCCKDDGPSCIYGFGHSAAWPCSVCGCRGWGLNRQGQGLPG